MIGGLSNLVTLHRSFQEPARMALEEMERRGLDPICTEGRRSLERQAELYAQGRSKPGAIVTKAQPGYSAHNWGLAIDVMARAGYNSAAQREVQNVFKQMGFFTMTWDLPHGEHPAFQTWISRFR